MNRIECSIHSYFSIHTNNSTIFVSFLIIDLLWANEALLCLCSCEPLCVSCAAADHAWLELLCECGTTTTDSGVEGYSTACQYRTCDNRIDGSGDREAALLAHGLHDDGSEYESAAVRLSRLWCILSLYCDTHNGSTWSEWIKWHEG